MSVISIPYLGDVDIGELKQGTGTAGPTGGGASIGAAAGSIVPGVGTAAGAAIGAMIEQISGMVKGRTQTFDWNTSNNYALKLSKELAKQLQDADVSGEFDRLATGYIQFVANYILSSGWWSSKRAQEVAEVLTSDKYGLYGKSSYDKVQAALWELSMWILTQSDKNRPEELPKFFATHLEGAFAAYWFKKGSAVSVTLPGAPSTAQAGTQPGPSTKVVLTSAQAADQQRTYLLIAGAIVLIVMTSIVLLRK